MTRTIPLTRGQVATVDAVDFRTVAKHKWHAHPTRGGGFYARTKIDGRRVMMHTLIAGAPLVDHRDGNGLNNTRLNLRHATPAQNARNRGVRASATSQFKGVYLFRPGRYRAMIQRDGRQVSLGFFAAEVDAARAYDVAAKELYGEFANLNFPETSHGVVETCVARGLCPVHSHELAHRPA